MELRKEKLFDVVKRQLNAVLLHQLIQITEVVGSFGITVSSHQVIVSIETSLTCFAISGINTFLISFCSFFRLLVVL